MKEFKNLRVRLNEEGEKKLWEEVSKTGIKKFAEETSYSKTQLYNWKNKELYYPIEFLQENFQVDWNSYIAAIKGKSSSKPVKNPEIPFKPSRELLTRIKYSVTVNKEGTPVYQSKELSLIKRFEELLQRHGNVPTKIYRRESSIELRYPKFFHDIVSNIEFRDDLSAKVDEIGDIKRKKIILPERTISTENFDSILYSRKKRFELAVQKEDSDTIEKLIGKEYRKIRGLE